MRQNFIFIYVLKCHDRYKVGISENPQRRIPSIQNTSPYDLEVKKIYKIPHEHGKGVESRAHVILNDSHIRGEWFGCEEARIHEAIQEAIMEATGPIKPILFWCSAEHQDYEWHDFPAFFLAMEQKLGIYKRARRKRSSVTLALSE